MNNLSISPKIKTGVDQLETWASELVVKDNGSREIAILTIRKVKISKEQIINFFKDSKTKAHAAWKSVVASEKSFTDRLEIIEKIAKGIISKYDTEQEEIRRNEQARLQADADAQARRERERLEKEAAKLKTPEKIQERLEQAEAVIAPIVQVVEAEKVKGSSTKEVWKARVVDVSIVPREYMIVNQKALDAFAKATKGAINIKGVEFYSESSLNIRYK